MSFDDTNTTSEEDPGVLGVEPGASVAMEPGDPLRYRSALERQVAAQLKASGVPFEYEPIAVEYTKRSTGTRKYAYHPDFALPGGIFLECKGFLRDEDRSKLELIRAQYPALDLRIVFEDASRYLGKGWLNKRARYSEWADRFGFAWATGGEVPPDWLPHVNSCELANLPSNPAASALRGYSRGVQKVPGAPAANSEGPTDTCQPRDPSQPAGTPRPIIAAGERPQLVPVTKIIADPKFQLRARRGILEYDEGALRNYMTTLANGQPLDPILVANIQGELYVIRGYHRLKAYERFGQGQILAYVRPMTEAAAKVEGPLFDARIGSSMTFKDRRTLLRRYIKAGRHKLRRGKLKSVAEIAHDLRYIKPATIYNWLRKDFPKLADKMAEQHPGRPRDPEGAEILERAPAPPLDMASALSHIKRAAAAINLAVNRVPASLRSLLLDPLREKIVEIEDGQVDGVVEIIQHDEEQIA
jgi:hypothetical protein